MLCLSLLRDYKWAIQYVNSIEVQFLISMRKCYIGIFSYFNTDVWLGSFPTKSSRSYNPPPLEWLILCQMWWHGLNFYPKIKFGTEFFSTRFDLDKEFSHVFRAAVYFEPPGGFLTHFDCINWVLSWNA